MTISLFSLTSFFSLLSLCFGDVVRRWLCFSNGCGSWSDVLRRFCGSRFVKFMGLGLKVWVHGFAFVDHRRDRGWDRGGGFWLGLRSGWWVLIGVENEVGGWWLRLVAMAEAWVSELFLFFWLIVVWGCGFGWWWLVVASRGYWVW